MGGRPVAGSAHRPQDIHKGRSATREEPVYELYRNGIVHGSILNYDNITVATKAFNRLLAVADWAVARGKEEQHQAEEPATWSSVGRQLKEAFGVLMEQSEGGRASRPSICPAARTSPAILSTSSPMSC
ncbi:hypothetical protein ACFRKD_08185 [Streptomyces niveus]|uniref:hypothetical protein n=1 Tax=Streptomyces niveus TaxID=193462 RepID=UPI0036B39656